MLLFQENYIPLHQIKIHSMKRVIPFLPWIGALLLIAFALLTFESDLLWKVQQYNLFLNTSLFFSQMMVVPGGFLSYVSCFFTQFLFYPWLGVLLLCAWWLLLMWLTKRTFRIADDWAVLVLIPVAILLVADISLGYWHHFLKLRGYFFLATIGTTVAVAMLWLFHSLPPKLRIGWLVLAAAVGYPLFGAYALAAVLLMGIWTWRFSDSSTQNAIVAVVALLGIIAVPMFCYRYVYYQINFDDLWTAALPVFVAIETYPSYYIPYYLLGAFYLLMTVIGLWFTASSQTQATQAKTSFKKPIYGWVVQTILALVLVAGVWYWWYKDDNFHHELTIQHCAENSDWEGVLRECQQQEGVPTRAMVLMRNLALSRLGRQLDEMYNYPRESVRPNTVLPYQMLYYVFGRMIYYQYGLLNDCHRLCLEDGVEKGWSVELLAYMARCSLLMGETQAARKALNLLRHTWYHDEWADAMQQLVDHPEQLPQNPETGPVTHMLHYKNALGGDGGQVESYVMSQLASQNSDDPFFQEQAVLGALWMKDSKLFLSRFGHYARLYPQGPMPRIFQEAVYLFGKLENMPDIERFPFDKTVKQTYAAFMKEAKKYDNQSPETGRVALWPFYGNTYFYEYFFQRNNK